MEKPWELAPTERIDYTPSELRSNRGHKVYLPHLPTPSRHATMNDRLTAEIERIRSNPSIHALDEANVKQGVILPILNALDWNPFNTNEVRPEYPVQGGNVDYSLRIHGANKVFLEAKRPSEDLSKHQVQLLNYSFADGVPLAILTNGLNWWFYLPLRVGSWEERRFCNIDLRDGDILPIVKQLTHYLSMVRVESGEAITSAELHLDIMLGFKEAERALPKAWEQLITDTDGIVVHLLNDRVKEVCGHGADEDTIKRFLSGLIMSPSALPMPTPSPFIREPRTPRQGFGRTESYLNKQIVSFAFKGQTYKVKKWIDLLTKLAEQIYLLNQNDFYKIVEIKGTKRSYFSQDYRGLVRPMRIGNSGYYAMSKISAKDAVSISRKLLIKFGYSPDDLIIETA